VANSLLIVGRLNEDKIEMGGADPAACVTDDAGKHFLVE